MTTETIVSKLPFCDFCRPDRVEASYDAKSTMGPWGYMCESHFRRHGTKLGTGFGQKLVVGTDQDGEPGGSDWI